MLTLGVEVFPLCEVWVPGADQAALPYGSLALFDLCGNSLSVSGHSKYYKVLGTRARGRPRKVAPQGDLCQLIAKCEMTIRHPLTSAGARNDSSNGILV